MWAHGGERSAFPDVLEGRAEEPIRFYVSLIPDSEILDIKRYGAEGPGPEGSVFLARVRVADQVVLCIDSPATHAFTFTPSFACFVDCGLEAEMERLAAALAEGGAVMMPLGESGFSKRFAWVSDRFGMSWQLSLAA